MYHYVKQSGQGLRYDIISPEGERICIAHSEDHARLVVNALNCTKKK